MERVMMDLETLGTAPGCVVLSIGAVVFDEGTMSLGASFYEVIKLESCVDAGLTIDPATQAWWDGQSGDAKQVLAEAASDKALSLTEVLLKFNNFLEKRNPATVEVWGNGSNFDNTILAAAYRSVNLKHNWAFWNDRCFRTLKNLVPRVLTPHRAGVHHNALDDAIHQGLHAIQALRHLRGL